MEGGMTMFFKKRVTELEQLLTSVQMNSSNNYKDAAKADYESFWKRLEELKQTGKINEKTYRYYEHEGNKWQAKMKNYNHQNNVTGF